MVEGQGVRVVVRPVGGSDVGAQIENGRVIYRRAYPATDSVHVVGGGRSEEFLYLEGEGAPREFAYEISELSPGTRVGLVNGEVRFANGAGAGVKIEAPWVREANGVRRTDAVHWELDAAQGSTRRLRLVVAAGLRYPAVIDPSWAVTGSLNTFRFSHTATLLPSGKVLVAAGENQGSEENTAELYDPATGFWSNTGRLFTSRQGHTATLLPSGKVLVVGGVNQAGVLRSAELYDPATGTWSNTGSLTTERLSHTETLLPSGKVLVAGGLNLGGYVSSAELYDPAAGTWSNTGSLDTARGAHTATLLPSGKVLVAGGHASSGNSSVYVSGAELYDPAAGTWSNTGNLNTARGGHTATLLPSGKVLVAGGTNLVSGTFIILSSAELYDPAAGTWSNTGSLNTARDGHTATLLPSGKVLVGGGSNNSGDLNSAELYDPGGGTWSNTGTLHATRSEHTATLLPSGKVLVAGGIVGPGSISRGTGELYDPAAGTWSNTGALTTERDGHTATLLPSGKVLVAGGSNNSGFLSSAELYDPATGTWSDTGSLNTARELHTATLLPSGEVLVAGGINSSGNLSSAELYDPAAGTWSDTGSLLTARQLHTATLLPSGKVLVAGGSNSSGILSSAELYDPAAGTWNSTGSLNTARRSHTATLLPSGKVLVAGGSNNSGFLSSAELYNPSAGTWSNTGSLNTARDSHTATLLPSGNVLVAGGINDAGYLSRGEVYRPAQSAWNLDSSLNTARDAHTATLLPSGKVLVAGGINSSGFLSSAELYDPAVGWTNTSSLTTARDSHTATLLPSGKVLAAGGSNSSGVLSSAELYDQGLGFDPNWQPSLTTVSPSTLRSGDALTASGSKFTGISEASGGNSVQNSSSNYPLVQLLSLTNEQTLFLSVDAMSGWSDTSFKSTPISLMTTTSSGFPVGYALVTVFTNGIPSGSQFVLAQANPLPTSAQALNISTRLRVDTGDGVMIGGFIITGTVPKQVVLRGLGPSLVNAGIPAASVLNDPVIELHGSSGALITSNDNWKDSPQRSQIEGTVFQPTDDRESVILATLPPAAYTVILKGVGDTSGVGLVEVYDNNQAVDSELANISTRGFVQTQENVMIGGFILGANPDATRIAIRGLGPSLASSGLTNLIADPTLELHNGNGALLISNDNWQDDPVSAAQLTANGLAPKNQKESGIFTSLPPGQFTAILSDKNGGTGIGLIEIYNLR